jgi:hypothetical protein
VELRAKIRISCNEVFMVLASNMTIIIHGWVMTSWKSRPFLGGAAFLLPLRLSIFHEVLLAH